MEFRKVMNDMPTLPTKEGDWYNKKISHDVYQKNISFNAQMGGTSSMAGCPHIHADRAQKFSEKAFVTSLIKRPLISNDDSPEAKLLGQTPGKAYLLIDEGIFTS